MKSAWLLFSLFVPVVVFAKPSFVTVNGYDVEYEMSGNGKHTVFLEAGGSAGLSDWDPIFKSLAKNTRVIRYSRIGNGGSEHVVKNYSSEEYAEEARLVLEALHIKKPVVYVAHSYGAYIARRFAATYPEWVSGLMLVEPASEHDVDIMRRIDLTKAEKEIAQVKLDDMKNGMSNQYLDFWAKRPLPSYPEIQDIPVTVIASIKKYENPPLLFFTDEAREMWGELHSEWAYAFPQGKAVLTNKSYHFPQKDEPDMVVQEVFDLLGRINH
ncbi:alpha/beta hydrolase [Pseudoalteromonas sp. MB47]|uniref:alpha/beta fold hydrolase n=1 Tax=Pseudoalteromonas sp. MB47 TaxID=2588452 RepID=UPI00140AA7D4|nr:alpha/beta hydrolase [Pseudoalteromonas sp. MB47]NHH89511.1 Sigma factor SigB regulation protein RsbQ [Pseudoalteromonas sp. MB47]